MTRGTFFDMAVAEKVLAAGFHSPFPFVRVEKDGAGYSYPSPGIRPCRI